MNAQERTPYKETLAALETMMDPTATLDFWNNLGKEKIMSNCMKCLSVDGDCCAASKARLTMANSLSGIVDRQSAEITRLTRLLGEKDQVIGDLRAKVKP